MRRLLPAVAASMLLVLVGCSGPSDARSSDAAAPIKVAIISPVESQAVSLPDVPAGAQAAIDAVNAEGGINGVQIEAQVCNDHYEAEGLRRCVQSAVRDGAVAVFGLVSPNTAQIWPLLEQAKLPALSPALIAPADSVSPMSYPLESANLSFKVYAQIADNVLKARTVTPVLLDNAAASTSLASFTAGAEKSGVQLREAVVVPSDALDYAQYVAKATGGRPDALLSAFTPGGVLKLFKALAAGGTRVPVVVSSGTATEKVLAEAGTDADGAVVVSGMPAVTKGHDSTVDAFIAQIEQYRPDVAATAGGLRAWAGVQLFVEAARGLDGPVTRDALVRALDTRTFSNFLWLGDLSFAAPGPDADSPRLTNWKQFVNRSEGGTLVPGAAFDPYAH